MTTQKPQADLDFELDRYFEAAETTRAVRRGAGLKDWAMYSAAAGSALVAAQGADAAVVYSGVQNITLTAAGVSGGLSQPVNLDGAGGPDATLGLGWDLNLGAGVATLRADLFGANPSFSNQVFRLGSSADMPGYYAPGFNTGVLRYVLFGGLISGTWPGGHPISTSGFAGIAFVDTGNNPHFAWLRLRLRNDANGAPDQLTLVDWAYESTPNAPIHVGSIPEPGSLALLAAGAMGVAAFRRRRNGEGE
jgi:hypothetical protein